MTEPPLLFSPLALRGVTLPDRIGVSPMCMYASVDGHATDFHLAHLGRFALGGAGTVIMEATAIEPRGRISPWDAGIWSDDHLPALGRIAALLRAQGSVPGIQLSHAGRRASVGEPWRGGLPLRAQDEPPGFGPWSVVGPSPLAAGPGFPEPAELTIAQIELSISWWAEAARRAVAAGFRLIELHGAHGYLLHQFLSPISNRRDDAFGGSWAGRLRYPLEVVRAVRKAIGPEVALSYRVSVVDGVEGGLGLDDAVALAEALGAAGIDLVDTSSGGITTDRSRDTRVRRGFAFHADFSREIRRRTGLPTATVGLIVDPEQARMLVQRGDADVVLLGRQMLDDPNWALHARRALDADELERWHVRYGSAIGPLQSTLRRLADSGETPLSRFE